MPIYHDYIMLSEVAMAGKFNLKWSDYLSNIAEKFSSLRKEEDFFDVTLVSCDKRQVSAHKVILSSCSEYFKTILKNNSKTSNTILCLENIYFEELTQILDYVYEGEVQIKEDQLENFLKIAQRFELQGLLSDGSEEEQKTEEESAYTSGKIPKNDNVTNKNENIEVKQQSNVLSVQMTDKTRNALKDPIIISSERFYNIEELDEKIKGYIYKNDGSGSKKFVCAICNKLSRDFNDAKKHVEVHFDGLCFPCPTCDKTFRSRNTLKSHVSFVHKSGKQSKNLLRDAGAIKQEGTSFKLDNYAMDSEISISKLASN